MTHELSLRQCERCRIVGNESVDSMDKFDDRMNPTIVFKLS
jgi:hypothetical protein